MCADFDLLTYLDLDNDLSVMGVETDPNQSFALKKENKRLLDWSLTKIPLAQHKNIPIDKDIFFNSQAAARSFGTNRGQTSYFFSLSHMIGAPCP